MTHISSPMPLRPAGTCTSPTLVGRGLRAFGLGLVVLFALAAPAAAQPVVTCNANDNCFDDNPCTQDRCLRDPMSALPGVCDYTQPAAPDTVCRGAAGVCDAPETCGGSLICPLLDQKRAAGTVCNPADPTRTCDAADVCDGVSNGCVDRLEPAGTVCRASGGE